jgi:hypothetical protein
MSDVDRCYSFLELELGDSPEKAKQAYRDLAFVWHPDRYSHNPRLQQKANEKLKAINEACEYLRFCQPSSQTQSPPPQPKPEPSQPPRPASRAKGFERQGVNRVRSKDYYLWLD